MSSADSCLARLPDAVQEWVDLVCPAFGIPEAQWLEVADWLREAMRRWLQHIEDPGGHRDLHLSPQARAPQLHLALSGVALHQRTDEDAPDSRARTCAPRIRTTRRSGRRCWPCFARNSKSASCTSPTCSSKAARMSCASRKPAINRPPTMRPRRSLRSTTSADASSTPVRLRSGWSATRGRR